MRRSVHDALTWLRHESEHPTANRKGLCQQTARLAWGLPAWSPSARQAWLKTPQGYRHYTKPEDVPPGALCYGLLTHTYGHVWVAGHGPDHARVGWSIDYKRSGKVDRVPLLLPAWTHDSKVHWSDWTPLGRLPL
jgi:hypothetical protein